MILPMSSLLRAKEVMFLVMLVVCLSVCLQDNFQSGERISMKPLSEMYLGTRNNSFNFRDDPDYDLNPIHNHCGSLEVCSL